MNVELMVKTFVENHMSKLEIKIQFFFLPPSDRVRLMYMPKESGSHFLGKRGVPVRDYRGG